MNNLKLKKVCKKTLQKTRLRLIELGFWEKFKENQQKLTDLYKNEMIKFNSDDVETCFLIAQKIIEKFYLNEFDKDLIYLNTNEILNLEFDNINTMAPIYAGSVILVSWLYNSGMCECHLDRCEFLYI